MSTPDDDDFVPITGVVRLVTDFGAFVIITGRQVFIPVHCTGSLGAFKEGDAITFRVAHWYAKQQRLIA